MRRRKRSFRREAARSAHEQSEVAASLYAIGIPGIAVVTHSTQDADNKGDDENRPTQANPVSVDVPIR